MEVLFYIGREAISTTSESDSIALRSNELHNVVTGEMIACRDMWL
jgi:hypothetical protein